MNITEKYDLLVARATALGAAEFLRAFELEGYVERVRAGEHPATIRPPFGTLPDMIGIVATRLARIEALREAPIHPRYLDGSRRSSESQSGLCDLCDRRFVVEHSVDGVRACTRVHAEISRSRAYRRANYSVMDGGGWRDCPIRHADEAEKEAQDNALALSSLK